MIQSHLLRALPLIALATMVIVGCGKDSTSTNAISESLTEDPNVAETAPPEVDRTGQLLRHAVFFSFKEESSEEDVQGVADAFAALPGKIETIADFEWGTNNSPEEFDDGFTHCFFLSFKTAKDRDEYIPNPAHSGEFADVLRPHMKDVFVIDYWGTPSEEKIETPLRHAVFFKFKDDAAPEDVAKVEQEFAALKDKIGEIKAFEWGTNNSPEKNDDGFTHCFFVTFANEADRKTYLDHKDHLAFVEVLTPVLDKVRVLDYFAK